MNTIHRQNKIITHHLLFEWIAYHEGDWNTPHHGCGRTREEAIADLERLDNEWSEAMDRGES